MATKQYGPEDLLPATAIELVDWLAEQISEEYARPQMDETERYIFYKQGRRDLVLELLLRKERTLKPTYEEPEETPPENTPLD